MRPLSRIAALVTVASILLAAAHARAQEPQAGTAPGAVARIQSFESLSSLLKAGQRVIVTDEAGRSTQARLRTVSDTQLVVAEQKQVGVFRRRAVDRVFARDDVRRVLVVDSPANGILIGVAGGLGVLALTASSDDDQALVWAVLGPLYGVGGALLGGLVDSAVNRIVYERPANTRVTIAPLIAPQRIGVAARVGF